MLAEEGQEADSEDYEEANNRYTGGVCVDGRIFLGTKVRSIRFDIYAIKVFCFRLYVAASRAVGLEEPLLVSSPAVGTGVHRGLGRARGCYLKAQHL